MTEAMRITALSVLVLAVAGTAGADVLPAGPVVFHVTSLDAGTVYGAGVGTYGVGGANGALPVGIPGLNSQAGEGTWGIFTIDTITAGTVLVPGTSIGAVGGPVWSATPGDQLVGILWGETDTSLTVDAGGKQTAEGVGLNVAIWAQSTGFSLAGQVPGSRTGAAAYPGIGGGGSTLWFTGVSTPGFLTAGLNPAAEFESTYTPTAPGTASGDAASWLSAAPVDLGSGLVSGLVNPVLDTNFFIGAGTTADLRIQITTTSLNPFNLPPGPFPGGRFTVSDSDPVSGAVPEPVTMISAFMAISSLGVYIRRRMKVTAA